MLPFNKYLQQFIDALGPWFQLFVFSVVTSIFMIFISSSLNWLAIVNVAAAVISLAFFVRDLRRWKAEQKAIQERLDQLFQGESK